MPETASTSSSSAASSASSKPASASEAPAVAPTPASAPSPAPVSAPAAAPVADTVQVTLEEWCVGQSSSDRRVELLSAFHADELANGRVKDAANAYASRLNAFATRTA